MPTEIVNRVYRSGVNGFPPFCTEKLDAGRYKMELDPKASPTIKELAIPKCSNCPLWEAVGKISGRYQELQEMIASCTGYQPSEENGTIEAVITLGRVSRKMLSSKAGQIQTVAGCGFNPLQ